MKTNISGCRYVLAVQNLEKSVDFYKNKLGFHALWDDEGWHFLVRDQAKIMLGECPDDVPAFETGCHSYFAYFEVDNIDILYQEYQTRQLAIVSPIENKPWGMREFGLQTIDGHRITFGEGI